MLNSVRAALVTALRGDATLVGLLGGSAVYSALAPQNVSPPYVLVSTQWDRLQTDDPQRKEDYLITVKAVTVTTPAASQAIAERVDTLLDNAPLTVSGKRILWQRREEGVEYAEEDQQTGRVYYHAGALYRVRIAYDG